MKKILPLTFLIALCLTSKLPSVQASVLLEESYFSTFKSYSCGYVGSTWLPGVRTGDSFETFKQLSARYRNDAKANRRNRHLRAYYTKLAQRVDAKYKASYRGCKKLAKPVSNAATTTLSKLPSIDSLVRENPAAVNFTPRSVIGTPPPLVNIPDLGAKNVFWNSGVVDAVRLGSASSEQCSQFLSSGTDGNSAGYGGCFMSQSVTETLGIAINSGNTLCYMKNAPTSANFAAGAINLLEGSLPAGGIAALFAPPSGSVSRIVGLAGIDTSGSPSLNANEYFSFVRVYSTAELAAGGHVYRYDFWSCENGAPQEVEQTAIATTGVYGSLNYSAGSRQNELQIGARVSIASDGSMTFDPTQNRTLNFRSVGSDGAQKLSAIISGSNTIVSKFYNNHVTDTQYGASIANFSGTRFSNLRFLSGASKDKFFRNSILQFSTLSGMEYRNSNYVSAPAMPEVAVVGAVDIDNDGYFSSPSAPPAPTGFSCAPTVNIGISMNFSSPALAAVQETCEGDRRDNLAFCWRDTDLAAAQIAYHTSCP